MDFADKRVLVLGMARSGIAAAEALYKRGALVTIYDRKSSDMITDQIRALPAGVEVVAGHFPHFSPEGFDLAVVSPGISMESDIVTQVQNQGVTIIGEIELAFLLKPSEVQFIAITGTNGKTTTTALVAEILNNSGIESVAAGNIGIPLVSIIEELNKGIAAVEVSSFQLETTSRFHPVASGIINVTPDHLDRHKTMQNYAAIKARIFENQSTGEYAFLNLDDPWTSQMHPPCKVRYFSASRILEQGVWVEKDNIFVCLESEKELVCCAADVKLRGKHNLENILCAVGVTRAVGVPPRAIKDSLISFGGVRHRLEEVRMLNGVLYVNDSKGTNPDSTIKALESFNDPVILIAGGRNKGSDFSELAKVINDRVKSLVLVGEAMSIIRKAVQEQGFEQIFETASFEEAVVTARKLARPGDVVLLSPACASWDMFNNFEERGDLFCSIVCSFGEVEACD